MHHGRSHSTSFLAHIQKHPACCSWSRAGKPFVQGLLKGDWSRFMQASHVVFKWFEPHDPVSLVCLLVGVPGIMTAVVLPHHSDVISAARTSFVTYFTTLVISILAYRLSPWHPLAEYPGPIACKISKLWFAAISLGGKQHLYQQQLHDQYGDVVRVGKCSPICGLISDLYSPPRSQWTLYTWCSSYRTSNGFERLAERPLWVLWVLLNFVFRSICFLF